MKYFSLSLVVAAIVLLSCEDEGDVSPEITYEQSGCYGPCPTFSIQIHSDGSLRYIGLHYVPVQDTVFDKVNGQQVNQLIDAFERSNYFSFKDNYLIGPTDYPTAYTSYKIKGRYKSVTHYFGDKSAPAELDTLYLRINRILNAKRWLGTDRPF